MSSSKDKKRKYWRHLELIIGITIAAVLVVVILSPVVFSYYLKNKFSPRTTVAGVSVSYKTLDEATRIFNDRFGNIETKKLTLNIDQQSFESDFQKLGIKFEWNKSLRRTYERQHSNNLKNDSWELVKTIFGQADYNIPAPLVVDKTNFNAFLDDVLAKANKNPTDAVIRVDNNQVVIDKEGSGLGVEKTSLESLIYKNLMAKANQTGWDNLKLTVGATILPANVTESSLTDVKAQADLMTHSPITMTFEDRKYTAGQQDMVKWLKFETKEGVIKPVIDRAQVDRFVAGIAKKVDIMAITKKLSSLDGSVLQEGRDGRSLARAKLSDDIISLINQTQSAQTTSTTQEASQSNQPTNPTPNYTIALQVDVKPFSTVTAPPPFTPGMYPGKYMEVNLSEQKMYLWDGVNKVAEYRVSTGKKSTPTPEGTFNIYNKASVGRYFPWIMPWWMGVHNGVGIHELPVDMRTGHKEGINDIGYAVSHGCIRLAVGEAKQVYDFGEVGMPVYIHK